MTDWMTVRVVLLGRRGESLREPPGRLMLVHADHSFADLSEAVDIAFGRWDLSPVHEFTVEGRRLAPRLYARASDAPDDAIEADTEDSDEVTIGEAGLRRGARFSYRFDAGEGWAHDCLVLAVDVDPVAEYGEEPATPVPLYGWGTIPDQYGRAREDDTDGEDLHVASDGAGPGLLDELPGTAWTWTEPDPSTWAVVAEALADTPRPRDDAALTTVARDLRVHEDYDEWPYDVLWAAAGLDDDDLPEDDEELWLLLAAGVVRPRGALPLDAEAEAAWAALEPADWAGAVIELVRAGVGQPADPETLLSLIAECPELEEAELTPEDEATLLAGLQTIRQLWTALGAIDAQASLTPLGRWGLPESLRLAWMGRPSAA